MVKHHNRLLITSYVITDSLMAMLAFSLAYLIRFESGLIPVTKGFPSFTVYLNVLPAIGLLVPFSFQLVSVYRLRRGRSRVDDFFAVLVGSILAVIIGLSGTLYIQAYYVSPEAKTLGLYEFSRVVWAVFLLITVVFTYTSRELIRQILERRWRAGIGLKRVLITGTGDLGRRIADTVLDHPELGQTIVGFIDDRAGGDRLGYRGLPLLGILNDVAEIIQRENIDQLYIALSLEQHAKMLKLIEVANQEFVDVKIVPDLLQFIVLRAQLEDLDGLPIININDVPLQGLSSAIKRFIDVTLSSLALVCLSVTFAIIALAIRATSKGPVFYRQERMGLDGKSFAVYKFRSMTVDAERESGPVWAQKDDPRRTELGKLLRRFSIDELPQLLNVLRGEMSLVGPRPERPFFVDQFRMRLPQYMLRHKVKSGITGWAQVNGLRGNTSIEKRIEYDLYYIENWSVSLDFKIIWLTVVWVFFHKHAY